MYSFSGKKLKMKHLLMLFWLKMLLKLEKCMFGKSLIIFHLCGPRFFINLCHITNVMALLRLQNERI